MLARIFIFLTETAAMHDNKNKRIILGKYGFINSMVTRVIRYICVLFRLLHYTLYAAKAKSNRWAFSNTSAVVLIILQFCNNSYNWKIKAKSVCTDNKTGFFPTWCARMFTEERKYIYQLQK